MKGNDPRSDQPRLADLWGILLVVFLFLLALFGGTGPAQGSDVPVVYIDLKYQSNLTKDDGSPVFVFPMNEIEKGIERGGKVEMQQLMLYQPRDSYRARGFVRMERYTSYDRQQKGRLVLFYSLYYKDTKGEEHQLCSYTHTYIRTNYMAMMKPARDELHWFVAAVRSRVLEHHKAGRPTEALGLPGSCRDHFGYRNLDIGERVRD